MIAGIALTALTGFSQTTIYSQNFGAGTSLPTGWTSSGNNAAQIIASASSVSSGYTTPITASGTGNLADNGATAPNYVGVATVSGVISTVGYNNIQFIHAARRTSAYTGVVAIDWSNDGATWNSVSYTDVGNTSAWAIVNGSNWMTLPAGAENQANLRFRFTFTRVNNSGNYRIDDFTVRGNANVAPSVASTAATGIGTTTATLNGNVTSAGSASVTERGFCYKTSAGVTTNDNKTSVAGTTGAYTLAPTLNVNQQYYFVAYAINSVGTTLSTPELNFWTLANTPTAPTVNGATSSSLNVALGAGDGNPATTTYAIQETTSGNYVQAGGALGVSAVYQSVAVWGTKAVTGLVPATTYNFQVIAKNGAGTATTAGPATGGTTSAAIDPTISVTPASIAFLPTAVNGASASQTYTVSGVNLTGNITITAPANFQISTASGSGFGASVTLAPSAGVVTNTTIYVVFNPTAQTSYAANITHASAGANSPSVAVSGVGANAPAIATQSASNIATAGATLNGTVTASNNAVLTDRGFYYNTSSGVSAANTQVSEGGTTVAAFSAAITGLNPNQIYYYRAYARNSVGTTLDASDTSFYTLANVPVAPAVSSPTQTSLQVAVGSGDGNPVSTTYAMQETGSSKYVQADGTLAVTAVFQTAATWGTKTVTGLTAGQVYSFRVQAQNGASVITAFGPATIANTANPPFTPGDLAILSPDNGGASITTFSIIEINPNNVNQSTPVQKISVNGTIGNPGTALIMGTSGTSGGFSTSSDGSLLVFPGYNTTNIGTGANTLVRGAGTLNAAGVFNFAGSYTGVSGNQTRGATSLDNNTIIWADKGGVYTNSETLPSYAGNVLRIRSFGGTVYVMNAQNLSTVVSTLPADASALNPLPGFPSSGGGNAADFYLIASGNNGSTYDVLYRVDSSSSSGIIYKYSLVSGTWNANSSYTTSLGAYSICAAPNGSGGVTLYIVTGTGSTGNKIEKLTDNSGYNADISITDNGALYTAPGTSSFKCVSFAPKAPLPTITSAPANVSVVSGNPATFTVVATSDYTISYQWLQNGTNLVDATNSSLTLPGVTTASSGFTYQVIASNSFGSVTSTPAAVLTVTVVTVPPTITSPANLITNFVNATETFPAVVVAGTAPFTYQWYHGTTLLVDDGAKYSGSTSTSLSVTNLALADAGNYYLTVQNSAGRASNLVATLSVQYILPVISTQPKTNTLTLVGVPTSVSVSVAGGSTQPQTTQWYKDGVALTDSAIYSGTADNSLNKLTITPASTNDSGAYTVVISNGGGSVTSSVANVTVIYAAAPSYLGYSNQVYLQNFDSLPNPGATTVNVGSHGGPVTIGGITYSVPDPFEFAQPVIPSGNIGGLGLNATMPGWYGFTEQNLSAGEGAQVGASSGDQSTGGTISFGATDSSNTNRALGLIATSTSGKVHFALKLINQSASALNYVNLSFIGEYWRQNSTAKTLEFGYNIDPAGTNSTILTAVAAITSVASLNVNFPIGSPGSVSLTNLGVGNLQLASSWLPGQALWLVWSINDASGSGQGYGIDNLAFSATPASTAGNVFYPATDGGPGFFSGETLNLFTNSGQAFYVWSSADPKMPVGNWTLEGSMDEHPSVANPGMSTYGITVNPSVSPVYYIVAQNTNVGPYTATEALMWLTTSDYVAFNLTTTNLPISTNGVFQFPTSLITPLFITPGSFHVTVTGATSVASFGFTNASGLSFSVLATDNLKAPQATWSVIGAAVENPAGSGHYQFTDPNAATNAARYYRLSQP